MTVTHHIMDLGVFLLVALAPLPLCLSVLAGSADRKGLRGPAHTCLVLLVCWCIVQTTVGLVLGLAHGLALTWVVAAETAVLVAGLLAFRQRRRLGPSLSVTTLFASDRKFGLSGVLIVGPLACLAVALLWTLSVRPINEWDSLAYHLPTLATWYQAGNFARLEPHAALQSGYPCGWEVLSALFLIPFREDFLVALPNLVAWLLLGLSIYGISRELGATTAASAGAAALTMTIPCVAESVNTIHVDIGLGACFTAALYFAILYRETRSMTWLGLAFGATGIVVGAKTSGLMHGALLLALVGGFHLSSRGRRDHSPGTEARPRWPIAIAGTCCLLFTGGFWYVKNWLELGNPLAPVALSIGHTRLLPGYIQRQELLQTTLLYMLQHASSAYWRAHLVQARDSLGPSFGGMVLLALAAVGSLALTRKSIPNRVLLALLALAAVLGILHVVTPFSGQQISALRYAIPFYASLAVVGAVGVTAARIPGFVVVAAALIGILTRLVALRMSFALLLLPVAWGLVWLARKARTAGIRSSAARPMVFLAIIALSATALALGSFLARQKRADHRTLVYGTISEFIMTAVQPHERIGYLMSSQPYLLYGTDLRRQVVYLPLRSHDRSGWLRYLRQNHIALVAVGPTSPNTADRELQDWLEGPAGPLVRVFGTDPSRPYLYRLRPAQR